MRFLLRCGQALLISALFLIPLQADEVSFGALENRGMAGAGLALMRNPSSQVFINPAAASYIRGFKFGIGSINLAHENATLRQIEDVLEAGQGGIVDLNNAARIIRTFGEKDHVRAVFSGDLGLSFSSVCITGGGVADMRFYSNPSLRRWASGATNDLTRDARGDVYGAAAYSLPDITAARRFFTQTGEVSAGLRLRRLKAYYTHYFAGYSALTGGNAGLKAPELGGKSYLSKTGASIDLGFFWRFQEAKMSALALVIENFIEPNIKFPATDTQGFPAEIKPFKRAINLGAAAELPLGVVVAGDILDFGNNAGRSEIRAGAEKRFTPAFALQAGYGTRNGPAFGVNLFGFNVSVAKKFPVQVSRTLSF